MKKTDLYRSIDSVKPDKELKSDILKAVGENDKITVIKRPLFIPIMVGILVCINIGMAAKLVIFNKSQINMSDFEARASLSSASGKDESSVLTESDKSKTINVHPAVSERTFASCLSKLKKDIDDDKLAAVYECNMSEAEDIPKVPYYMTNDWSEDIPEDKKIPEANEFSYVRYVEKVTFGDRYMLTNHEYIVVYCGERVPENIVSITESNVDASDISDAELEKNFKKLNENIIVSQNMEKIAYERIDELDPDKMYESRDFGIVCNILMYHAVIGNRNASEAVRCCYYSLSNEQYDEWEYSVYDTFFLNDKGEEVSYEFNSSEDEEKYWKNTLYRPETVSIPDIIGMDLNEARKTLEDAGLKLGTQDYGRVLRGTKLKLNQVMECPGHEAGEVVDYGTPIDVSLCPNAVPFVNDIPLKEAKKLLKEKGLSCELKYFGYENAPAAGNEDELYVMSSYPNEGMPISDTGKVTLLISSYKKGVAEELLGNVISMNGDLTNMRIYKGEEAEEKIGEAEYSHEFMYDLIKVFSDPAFSDITINGMYYSNEYIKIDSMVIENANVYAVPYLKCGMACQNGAFKKFVEGIEYYMNGSLNWLETDGGEYDYAFHYENEDNGGYIYIKTVRVDNGEGEMINKICVSDKVLAQ